MGWTEHRFLSFDATPLFHRRLEAEGPARAAAIIVHGMGEHGGRYRGLAEHLAAIGVASYVPDLRGFGSSGGGRACVRSLGDHHRDLAALHALAARERKGLPLFLVGHSFGGLLASSYLADRAAPAAVRGLVLSSPIFGIAKPVPAWRHALGVLASALAPDYAQPTGVQATELTHDAAVLAAYASDPLIHHRISARLYRVLTATMARGREIAGRLELPVLVLQAGADRVVSRTATESFFRELASPDKTLRVYEDLYHEVFNETERAQIYAFVGRWMLDRL